MLERLASRIAIFSASCGWALSVTVLSASALSGCAVFGRQQKENPLDGQKVAQVRKGMSRAEVLEVLGAPQEIIFSNREHDPLREHAYVYEHVMTKYTGITFGFLSFGNSDQKKDRTVVFFDETGNVLAIGATLAAGDASYDFPFGS
jgi:outer membrane protein assembly factor BamE (lipoprotein component of BamABCDE complex)